MGRAGLRFTFLGSGSRGNAALVRTDDTAILLEAGLAARELAARCRDVGQDPHALDAILISHEHTDHIRGAAAFSRRFRVPVTLTARTLAAARLSPARVHRADLVEAGQGLRIKSLAVTTFPVPHDAAETLGFTIRANGATLGYATDFGHATALMGDRLTGCQILVIESNHDPEMLRTGPYTRPLKERIAGRRGHASNVETTRFLTTAVTDATRQVVLAHLSQQNNDPQLAAFTAEEALARTGRPVPVSVGKQDQPSCDMRC